MTDTTFYPSASATDLRSAFIGKSLNDVPVPSAILDISKLKHNCNLMLNAVSALNLSFRAHVKTHKTSELTRLQVGEDSKDVRLIVSTVVEAEALVPLLKEYQGRGATVNVLYGVPLGISKVARLAAVARQLGPGSVAVMIDHPAQLVGVERFQREAGARMEMFVKADSGYHRAGIPPSSETMVELVEAVLKLEGANVLNFTGFYSHNSLSYNGDSPDDAMAMLKTEIDTCRQAASQFPQLSVRETPLVISVGASPTALSIQNIQPAGTDSATASSLLTTLSAAGSDPFTLEIHAGVYPLMDLQQVSASSRLFHSALASHHSQALTILAEVVSLYPTRTSTPEALISAGTLALAREPCKSYPGWGVISAWNLRDRRYTEDDSVSASTRMIVKRVSQEHGVVGWEDEGSEKALPLKVGDKLRVWVNHACIASVGFGWYLVVDGEHGGEEVVDVWVRWRGW